mmetsp:Transcript_10231/g.25759  ORF Transcript_10231/g.25759 Transcript_10231/m.25759 type:complete len:303 (+) Transcript_10231:128-1036(+)
MGGDSSNSNAGGKLLGRCVGSAIAGFSELALFHPVDTIAKRLMTKEGTVAFSQMNAVIFRDAADAGWAVKARSLFPGLGYAAGYKILQRVYKFGGQPFVLDLMRSNCSSPFEAVFGKRNSKAWMHATAGSLIGVGEVALLPLDVLKIRAQTNPQALSGKGFFGLVQAEGLGLYRGAGWTAVRNAPGSFALFGGSAFVKDFVFGLEDYNKATFAQTSLASIAGATASITVAAPMDVIKTRIQSRAHNDPKSGAVIIAELFAKEGPGALFKGLLPKLLTVGPKLVFSFTVAQYLIALSDRVLIK